MILLLREAEEIIEFSGVIATNLGHSFIGTEHLLLALLGKTSSRDMLEAYGFGAGHLDYSEVMSEVIRIDGQGERQNLSRKDITKTFENVIFKSFVYAKSHNSEKVSVSDIVHVLFRENDSTAMKIVRKCKADVGQIKNSIIKTDSLTAEKLNEMRKLTPVTNSYTSDLTQLALENKLDPVIEREKEIERVIQILMRKNKNNPCLVGNAGVGKTSIAEGLAQSIVEGKVPTELAEKRIVSLNMAMLLSGAKYRGDFEERISNILSEIKKARNVILMIDEIHNIVNTGAGEGTLDAANILKPELARGEISVIGATTYDEYSRTIEKDGALDRRFQKVIVGEPSKESCLKMLKGLKGRYEKFHKVEIDDAALESAVEISVKEIKNRYLPDKAVDLIDESAAFIRLENRTLLTSDDIRYSFYKGRKKVTYESLEKSLKENILGQDKQIKEISKELVSNYSGINKKESPLSLLFVGASGCGKTVTALKVAEYLFGTDGIVRIDMGDFSEPHSVSRLIGSPPGYVGYEDKGILINEISKGQNKVFLFDEIEKAHVEVRKILLNILDSGIAYDSRGRAFDFGKSVFILTSNVGFERSESVSGFLSVKSENNELMKILGNSLYGRIDRIIAFELPSSDIAYTICDNLLCSLKQACREHDVELDVGAEVIKKVVSDSQTEKLGYRNVKKVFESTVQREINLALAEFGEGIKKVTFYLDDKGEIAYFSDFGKLNLENKDLSMYNNQKRID